MNKKLLVVLITASLIGITSAEYTAKVYVENINFKNGVTPDPETPDPETPDLGDITFTSNYTNGEALNVSSSGHNFTDINDPANTYNTTSTFIKTLNNTYTNNGSGNVSLWLGLPNLGDSFSPYEVDPTIYSNQKLMNYLTDYYNNGIPINDSDIRNLTPITLSSGESISIPLNLTARFNGSFSNNSGFAIKALTVDKSYNTTHTVNLLTPYYSGISTGDACLKNNINAAPTYCAFDISTSNKIFDITVNNPTSNMIYITGSSFISAGTSMAPSCGVMIAPDNIPAGGSSIIQIDLTSCPDPWVNYTNWIDIGILLENDMGFAFRLRGY